MKPLLSRSCAVAALVLAGLAPACAVDPAGSGEPETESTEGELRSLKPAEILGSIAYGQTSAPVSYVKVPLYRAFSFQASAGDDVHVAIKALSGTGAQLWLTDAAGKTLSISTSGDLPSTKVPTAGTHYIVFRSKSFAPASYEVTLTKNAPPPPLPPTWNVPSALVGVDLPIELSCRRGSWAPWSVAGTVRLRPAGAPEGRVEIVELEDVYSYPSAASMLPAPCRESANEVRCGDGNPTYMTVGRPYPFALYSIYDGKLSVTLRQTVLPTAPGQLDVVTCSGGMP